MSTREARRAGRIAETNSFRVFSVLEPYTIGTGALTDENAESRPNLGDARATPVRRPCPGVRAAGRGLIRPLPAEGRAPFEGLRALVQDPTTPCASSLEKNSCPA